MSLETGQKEKFLSTAFQISLVLLGVLVAFSVCFLSTRFALGVFVGGVLSLLNFVVLKYEVQVFLEQALRGKNFGIVPAFFLKMLALLGVLGFLIGFGLVDVIGLVLGLSIVVLSLMLLAGYLVFARLLQREHRVHY